MSMIVRNAQVVVRRVFNTCTLGLLFCSMVPLLCSYSQGHEKKHEKKKNSKNSSQSMPADWEKRLKSCAAKKDWKQFGALAVKAAKNGFHSGKLRKLAKKIDNPTLK